jgi:hypothetical protein
MKKPVKLQINTTGAWRNVIRFDADKDVEYLEVMGAAETLGRVAKATLRIVVENSPVPKSPLVLIRWSQDAGWKDAR